MNVERTKLLKYRFIPLRTSLAARITIAVLILSIFIVLITGTFLKKSVETGIINQQVRNAISNAEQLKSLINIQLLISTLPKQTSEKQVLDNLVTSSGVGTANADQSIVIVKYKTNRTLMPKNFTLNYDHHAIPMKLRQSVFKSSGIYWEKQNVHSIVGQNLPAIIVGLKIEAPKSGKYEIYIINTLKDLVQTFKIIDRSLIFAGSFLVLLIGLATTVISRKVIKPVREAAEIAENFTAGKYDERMLMKGDDEIARLATSFNGMAAAISQHINRLENLSALQQRFVSDVSHELRTPLTTIKMAAQVIESEKNDLSSIASRSAELLNSQIYRFEKLLTDLLELSRFDANAAVVEMSDFDLKFTLERVLEFANIKTEQFLKLDLPTEAVIIQADERRIERVLRNLISNAIDHRNGLPVEITIKQNDDAVAIGVRDFGQGFHRKDATKVFERFWRADPARTRGNGSTGLGLAISLEDAELHRGKLEAWGRPFRGANFVLTLPRSPSATINESPIRVIPESELTTIESINDDEGFEI